MLRRCVLRFARRGLEMRCMALTTARQTQHTVLTHSAAASRREQASEGATHARIQKSYGCAHLTVHMLDETGPVQDLGVEYTAHGGVLRRIHKPVANGKLHDAHADAQTRQAAQAPNVGTTREDRGYMRVLRQMRRLLCGGYAARPREYWHESKDADRNTPVLHAC